MHKFNHLANNLWHAINETASSGSAYWDDVARQTNDPLFVQSHLLNQLDNIMDAIYKHMKRNVFCRYYQTGDCIYGSHCWYKHELDHNYKHNHNHNHNHNIHKQNHNHNNKHKHNHNSKHKHKHNNKSKNEQNHKHKHKSNSNHKHNNKQKKYTPKKKSKPCLGLMPMKKVMWLRVYYVA